MPKLFPIILASGIALLLTFCNSAGKLELLPYKPIIVFSGYINSEQFSWPGNIDYPNRCYLMHDTLMMFFYSQDYQENPWQGDQLRLEIFHPDSVFIVTHSVIFHLSRYSTGPTNLTYDVWPSDTSSGAFGISMKIVSFAIQNGAVISLTNVGVTPHSSGSGDIAGVITQGIISGHVE